VLLPVQLQRGGLRLRVVVILLATALIVIDAVVYWPPEGCNDHPFQCGTMGGISGIALAAVAGVMGFGWLSRHVLQSYWRDAQGEPETIFSTLVRRPSKNAAAPSESVFETIAPSLDGQRLRRTVPTRWPPSWFSSYVSGPPQLVVGQAGEGKTTLLVQLTERLAEERLVPVPVSLRDGGEFTNFLELAKKAFYRTIDEQLASEEEGDRIWRWVCRSGRLVVLADDLQLLPSSAREGLAGVFREAERENYALVVTSRPDGVSGDVEGWRVPFDRLDAGEALGLTRNETLNDEVDDSLDPLVLKLIRRGELNESRYYLFLVARLRRHGVLAQGDEPPGRSRLAVRRWLLDLYVRAYLDGRLTRGDGLKEQERAQALAEIQQASYNAVKGGRKEARVRVSGAPIKSAIGAGLLRPLEGDEAQIDHALLESYLASRAIDGAANGWAELVDNEAGAPEARDALLFHVGTTERRSLAKEVVTRLLKRSREGTDAISSTINAADIAYAADLNDNNGELVAALAEVWERAGTLERMALVEKLAHIRSQKAIGKLWEKCDDGDYRVSWAAGCALAGEPRPARLTRRDQASRAARVLKPDIKEAIAEGRSLAANIAGDEDRVDDWHPTVRRLKRLGWILPVLAVGADDTSTLDHMDEVFELFGLGASSSFTGLTEQRGPEASIAQGFKAAARLAAWDLPSRPNPVTMGQLLKRLQALYEQAGFWYSRLVLLHGLTDMVIAIDRDKDLAAIVGDADRARRTICAVAKMLPCSAAPPGDWVPGRAPEKHEHAFVVEAAELCRTALAEVRDRDGIDQAREIRERYIWDDEGMAVGAPPPRLEPRALRLLGDVAVLLNLNEKGANDYTASAVAYDRKLRKEFGTNDYLPRCLSKDGDRTRILADESKECECPFHRCPYPENVQRAHREMSKLFSRQVRHAVDESGPPPWQPQFRDRAYRRFWLEMERKAKYGA
jgi:hypothetical protein